MEAIELLKKPLLSIRCISCGLSCQLYPDSALRVQYCNDSEFAIWPDDNHFLKMGVIGKLLSDSKNCLSRGFVFVDFSFPYLRLFSDAQWIEWLAHSGMHIVLLSDRSLAPLANYWLAHSSHIRGVIYADNEERVQKQTVHRLFTGRVANGKDGRSLNHTEFILLKRFMSGAGIQQIIESENIDVKKVYAHKLRLENKLGHSIHKIISNIL